MIITLPTVSSILYFSTKNNDANNPKLTVAIICPIPPTTVTIAAFILSPLSNMNILPRKFPVLFGKNIPAVMPVKIEI